MHLPVIALIGRPNVGKSTLFNRMTRSRRALVAPEPGMTRDRQFGDGKLGTRRFIVIDMGGIGEASSEVDPHIHAQVEQGLAQADLVYFLVDAQTGLGAADRDIAVRLRQSDKPVYLIINKIDGVDPDIALAEFSELGIASTHTISAEHGRGVHKLLETTLPEETPETEAISPGIRLAIVGRPNVGKSTMVNRMLGEDRVVVCDMPGTTRDSIYIPFERMGTQYTLIDTAGMRRRGKISERVEKFSVVKTLQAIEEADVVIVVLDGTESITEQDLHLIDFCEDAGRGLVLAINKWDGLETTQREYIRKEVTRRLGFVDYARIFFTSALHGTGIGELFPAVSEAYKNGRKKLATQDLNRILEDAITQHQPPLSRGRRIKLRYAHAGGRCPPTIVIHGTQTQSLPKDYQKYLINIFRRAFGLTGTPIRLLLRSGDNPYKDKRNKLTPRQMRKRKRLMKHHKKK